jgi:hypothetical protein
MSEPKQLFSARLAQDEIYSPAVHETKVVRQMPETVSAR